MTLRFYSPFNQPITTLSFDLDDTLYQNEEVIKLAEQAQFDAVCERVERAKEIGIEFWLQLKWQVLKSNPELCHDVTEWRKKVINDGLQQLNVESKLLNTFTQEIYDIFYAERSNFTVPENTFSVLKQLKQKFTLIAVTNGNADIHRIGLAPYFDAYYRAGENSTRMKPYPDTLKLACNELNLEPQNIVHIGDNVSTDVKAGHNASAASLWFNPDNKNYPAGFALPTGEYSHLDDLLQLL
ncbi:MAG: HAD-IA family hydrolase [Gammaproteobacteria bacterium]|nr:HAD-IA family hydrolase [Gammaproteobacteria bacterium]